MPGLIAVHCGAGEHKDKNYQKYNNLCKLACRKGTEVLKNGGTALEAVKAAVMALEDDPITNAGVGSNLTLIGGVEMDASIMDGKTLVFGGCGAVSKVRNPIELAYDICIKESSQLPLGLIPPNLLVGKGAHIHAKKSGMKLINNLNLITPKTLKQYKKYKALLSTLENGGYCKTRMDTVGAVCVDNQGNVASASSSGGLLLKRPGRIGQAALYASGVWADSYDTNKENSVAVTTTGCGEYLVKTLLAKEIGCAVKTCTCPTTCLSDVIKEKFLNSRYLKNIPEKMGGALVLQVSKNGEGEILWGHTTHSMSVGYMKADGSKPKGIISKLPDRTKPGTTVNVGGYSFDLST